MPRQRQLRSSQSFKNAPPPLTLANIRAIVEESKADLLVSIQCIKDEFLQLHSDLRRLHDRMLGIENSVRNVREIQESQQEEIDGLRHSLDEVKESFNLEDVLWEVEERERRRDNAIIHGLRENTDGTLKERQEADMISVQEMCEDLGLGHVKAATMHRFGKLARDRVRPLKVRFQDSFTKAEFIRKSKDLRNSTQFTNAFVSNDLTKQQQHEHILLRQELRRQKAAGLDVVIYRGQVRSRDSIKNFRL